jgi:cyclin H
MATKIEHKIIPLVDFLSKIPKSPSQIEIVDLELTVSSALKFDFMIKNPYWPLHGLFLDLQVFIQDQESLPATEKQTILQNLLISYNAAFQLVSQALQTDLIFLYPPSQIALSCMWASQTPDIQLKDYITKKLAVGSEVKSGIISICR